MFTLIKRLQRQPKEFRRKIGIIIAGSVTFIIFIVWLVTFNVRSGNESVTDGDVEILAPLSAIGETFGSVTKSTRQLLDQIGL